MTAIVAAAARRATVLDRARRAARRHPHLPALVLAAVAWVALLLPAATAGGHVHAGPPTLSGWVLMCVAMMVPVVLPAVRHVAVNSLRRRRVPAMGTFLLGYLAVWVLCGVVLVSAFARLPPLPLLVAVLLAAVLWQLLPARGACLRACHRTIPLPPTGWRAAVGALRFGLWHGVACLGVCGPLMAVMAVPGTHHPLWMLGVTAAVWVTRSPPRGRLARWTGPLVLDARIRAAPVETAPSRGHGHGAVDLGAPEPAGARTPLRPRRREHAPETTDGQQGRRARRADDQAGR